MSYSLKSEKIAFIFLVILLSISTYSGLQAGKNQVNAINNLYSNFSSSSNFENLDTCCVNIRGNIDGDADDIIDITDLVYMVDFMFRFGSAISCEAEADIAPNSAPDGILDIEDLVAMVDYQFRSGPPPPSCPELINIIDLQEGDNRVNGIADIPDTSLYKVVLWAKTNVWYVQPTTIEPFTIIQSDGSWSNFTNPWDRMVALLVDTGYEAVSPRLYHPSEDAGVIAYDEYPDKSLKFINWSNYLWQVKIGELVGPGPNYFSSDTSNVSIDVDGRLNLKINYRNDKWYCAEIFLDHSLGYGYYSFKLDAPADNFDYNTILGCFVYDTTDREFDFEFSQRLANPFNAQFVVQPWYKEGNIEFFNMPNSSQTSHSFEWLPDRITFSSWNGHVDTPTPLTLIHTWTYTGEDIPPPGNDRMRFNLYLYGGEAPISGSGDSVIISEFNFVAAK